MREGGGALRRSGVLFFALHPISAGDHPLPRRKTQQDGGAPPPSPTPAVLPPRPQRRRRGTPRLRTPRSSPAAPPPRSSIATPITAVANCAVAPPSSRTNRRRTDVAPTQANPTSSQDLGDPEQVSARPEHLTATQEPDDLLELGDPQQLRQPQVRQQPQTQPRPQRDDLAEEAAAKGIVEDVPDAEGRPRPAPPRRA